MPAAREDLFGCDTLVATATGTADRSVIFAKNSDRLPDECQHLRVYPSREWEKDSTVRCQYVTLAQGAATFSSTSPWWRIKRLLNRATEDWGKSFPRLRAHWQEWEQALLREAADHRKDSCDHKSLWVNRNVTQWLTEIVALERAFGLGQ